MKHSLVRQTIIETASDLFYLNGYNLTGINEIIKEAGIAKATLYNHFKSKEEICLAYLRYKNVTFLEKIGSFVNEQKSGVDKVLGVFGFLREFFSDKEFNGCWCINTVSELPRENMEIRSEIQKQKREFIKFIEGVIGDSFPKMSSKEKEQLAKRVYLLYEGAVSESHLHKDVWPIEESLSMCKLLVV